MTTKIKTTLLVGLLSLGVLTGMKAQVKYDYAMITYRFNDKILEVDINGEIYKRIDVAKKGDSYYIVPAALSQVKKMNNEGWELFDTGNNLVGVNPLFIFYLRKKIE